MSRDASWDSAAQQYEQLFEWALVRSWWQCYDKSLCMLATMWLLLLTHACPTYRSIHRTASNNEVNERFIYISRQWMNEQELTWTRP
jgi:hypothetical protein